MKEHNYVFTILGHHADDQIESVLLNLIRRAVKVKRHALKKR